MTKLGPLTQVDIPFKYRPSEPEEQGCRPSGLSTPTAWLPKTPVLSVHLSLLKKPPVHRTAAQGPCSLGCVVIIHSPGLSN